MTLIESRKKYNKKIEEFNIKDYINYLEEIALSYSQDCLCDKLSSFNDYQYAVYLENKIEELIRNNK